MKLLIIGPAPGPDAALGQPIEPLSGKSGRRLASLAGMPLDRFLERTERINLFEHYPGPQGKGPGDAFDIREARPRALELIVSHFRDGRRIVLLGTNVVLVFMGAELARDFPMFTWSGSLIEHGFQTAWSPHPSGLNRYWNDVLRLKRAQTFWRDCLR